MKLDNLKRRITQVLHLGSPAAIQPAKPPPHLDKPAFVSFEKTTEERLRDWLNLEETRFHFLIFKANWRGEEGLYGLWININEDGSLKSGVVYSHGALVQTARETRNSIPDLSAFLEASALELKSAIEAKNSGLGTEEYPDLTNGLIFDFCNEPTMKWVLDHPAHFNEPVVVQILPLSEPLLEYFIDASNDTGFHYLIFQADWNGKKDLYSLLLIQDENGSFLPSIVYSLTSLMKSAAELEQANPTSAKSFHNRALELKRAIMEKESGIEEGKYPNLTDSFSFYTKAETPPKKNRLLPKF